MRMLYEAAPALINAAGVLLSVVACYSVLVSQVFGAEAEGSVFASFASSFVALMRIACGDGWASTISREAALDKTGYLAYPLLLWFVVVVRVGATLFLFGSDRSTAHRAGEGAHSQPVFARDCDGKHCRWR